MTIFADVLEDVIVAPCKPTLLKGYGTMIEDMVESGSVLTKLHLSSRAFLYLFKLTLLFNVSHTKFTNTNGKDIEDAFTMVSLSINAKRVEKPTLDEQRFHLVMPKI